MSEFEDSLVYSVSLRSASATQQDPVSKKRKKKKKTISKTDDTKDSGPRRRDEEAAWSVLTYQFRAACLLLEVSLCHPIKYCQVLISKFGTQEPAILKCFFKQADLDVCFLCTVLSTSLKGHNANGFKDKYCVLSTCFFIPVHSKQPRRSNIPVLSSHTASHYWAFQTARSCYKPQHTDSVTGTGTVHALHRASFSSWLEVLKMSTH